MEQQNQTLSGSEKQSKLNRIARISKEKFLNVGFQNTLSRSFADTVVSIFKYKRLLRLLTIREISAKYKNSFLGLIWSLIKPLTLLLIYWIVIGKFLGVSRSIPQFAIFVFAGLTIWGLYSEIITTGTNSIVNNAGLIKKIYVPREIFPLAATGSALFNFLVQFIILMFSGTRKRKRLRIPGELLYLNEGVARSNFKGLYTQFWFLFGCLDLNRQQRERLQYLLGY